MLLLKVSSGLPKPRRDRPFSSSWKNTDRVTVPVVTANRCATTRPIQQSPLYSKPANPSTMRPSMIE